MKGSGSVALLVALVLFLIFFGNVFAASMGWGEFFGKVPQVLLLLAACIAFVTGILMKEARENANKNNPHTRTSQQ